MLNIKSLGLLMKITSKLDITPVIEKLKTLDIFENAENPKQALAQLTEEKAGIIAAETISVLLPQLGVISDFLSEFVAAYKNITIEEAEQLDALEVVKELAGDTGIKTFFKNALQKKAEQA